MAGCGTSFAKIMLIIFNIIFWLSGAALLGIGIWLLLDNGITKYFAVFAAVGGSGALLQYSAYVFIAVGSVVLIVGFFGCCGAIKENRCMLGVYIVLLVIIMGLEITAGVLAIIYKDKVEGEISTKLIEVFKEEYNQNSTQGMAFTAGLQFVQIKLECCGIKSAKDYEDLSPAIAPVSCCVLSEEGKKKKIEDLTSADAQNQNQCQSKRTALSQTTNDPDFNGKGCINGLKDWARSQSTILIGVGIGIACLELFGFIFAVCLCRSIGDDE